MKERSYYEYVPRERDQVKVSILEGDKSHAECTSEPFFLLPSEISDSRISDFSLKSPTHDTYTCIQTRHACVYIIICAFFPLSLNESFTSNKIKKWLYLLPKKVTLQRQFYHTHLEKKPTWHMHSVLILNTSFPQHLQFTSHSTTMQRKLSELLALWSDEGCHNLFLTS